MAGQNPIDALVVPDLLAGDDCVRPGDTVLVRLTVREVVHDFGKEIYIRTEAQAGTLRTSFWIQGADLVAIERRG